MRLDLYLKTSRLVKRRAVARELCDAGRVLVNGLEAKPGKDIKPGDAITLSFSSRIIDVEVLVLPTKKPQQSPSPELFRVRSETVRRMGNNRWNESHS